MATFNKYNCFALDLMLKKHNLSSDALYVALTNAAPNAATHAVLADITEIGAGNGYSAGGLACAFVSLAQSGGIAKLVLGDSATLTASGGSVGPFRYAVLYNSTPGAKPLIGWWDYGSALTLATTQQFQDQLSATLGVLQIS